MTCDTFPRYSNEWEERYEGRMRRLKAQEEAAKTLKAKDQETAKVIPPAPYFRWFRSHVGLASFDWAHFSLCVCEVEQDPDAPSMAIVPAS